MASAIALTEKGAPYSLDFVDWPIGMLSPEARTMKLRIVERARPRLVAFTRPVA